LIAVWIVDTIVNHYANLREVGKDAHTRFA
jgi:hypothetical protein